MGDEKASEWRTVFGRKKRSNSDHLQQIATSFYVSNLPTNSNHKLLWAAGAKFGTIVDAYVAVKYDRNGKRFGFLRYKGVRDSHVLENRLKEMKINGMNVSVNIAKFDRRRDNERQKGDTIQRTWQSKNGMQKGEQRPMNERSSIRGVKSFADIVSEKGRIENLQNKSCVRKSMNERSSITGVKSYADIVSEKGGIEKQQNKQVNVRSNIYLPHKNENIHCVGACKEILSGEAKSLEIIERLAVTP